MKNLLSFIALICSLTLAQAQNYQGTFGTAPYATGSVDLTLDEATLSLTITSGDIVTGTGFPSLSFYDQGVAVTDGFIDVGNGTPYQGSDIYLQGDTDYSFSGYVAPITTQQIADLNNGFFSIGGPAYGQASLVPVAAPEPSAWVFGALGVLAFFGLRRMTAPVAK